MVLKLKQDTVTSILFAIFILLVAVTGATTVVLLLPPSGDGWSRVTLNRMYADDAAVPPAASRGQLRDGFSECEVIYQQRSPGRMQQAGSSAAGHDVMGDLHYAVYTCTGLSITSGSYI